MNHDPNADNLPEKLAQPARRALNGAGIFRLEQVAAISEAQLKRLHGIGNKALEQLRQALSARGLSFADEKKQDDGD